GNPEEGLHALAEAREFADATAEGYWDPEIKRLEGELRLLRDPASEHDAEDYFQQAIEQARSQQAKSLELRAAMSLGRLWRKQGKADQASELIAGVYNWFTEGLDTHDLKDAKMLLEQLQ
ncbi:MAG: hypothetical protein QF473_35285, partial [Planctomycetota bacterium]|nr:hypothetical protein [Planctomycetota bacterium]